MKGTAIDRPMEHFSLFSLPEYSPIVSFLSSSFSETQSEISLNAFSTELRKTDKKTLSQLVSIYNLGLEALLTSRVSSSVGYIGGARERKV